MSRTADYTIQGFLYQFNKTALEILNAQDDETITVEGIVEDLEIQSPSSLKAIQCKYHEASTSFSPSTVYKPLLQMLWHFGNNSTCDIRYVLFAHFPTVSSPAPAVGKKELEAAISSTDKGLKKDIEKIPDNIDLDAFCSKFTMEFGPSYDTIVDDVGNALEESGFPSGEIDTLTYPNAIHRVATLSVRHDPDARKITKSQFVDYLKDIRTTAISRWTLALKTRKKILDARRKQLKIHLDKNARLRYFVIDPSALADYDTDIVLFISDYIDKYHFKPAHISTPVLCLCAERDGVEDIQRRLFAKDIVAEDGYIGGQFHESYFFRDPLSSKRVGGKVQREFALRIVSWNDHGKLLNTRKCDDLFIIGDPSCDSLDTVDVNVERLAGATVKEIKYIMGVSNVYE